MGTVKFPFGALFIRFYLDQAARVFDPLAWSYTQSRVFDPPSIFDAHAVVFKTIKDNILFFILIKDN